jgi:endonuclease/exonuclease/phosphatase family metal-dependent hydrolase
MLKSLFGNIYKLISAVVIFCTLLAYIAPYVHPRQMVWISHFATIFPALLFINLILIGMGIFGRHRFALYHAIMLLCGWGHIFNFIGVGQMVHAPNQAITVMSHNLGTMLQGHNLPQQWDKVTSDYLQFLKRNGDPDILCLQESESVVQELIKTKSGYAYHSSPQKGTIIFSRYKINAGADIPFTETGNSAQWVNINVEGKDVRIYNLHLQSNSVTTSASQLIETGAIEKKESWLSLHKILARVNKNTLKRAGQAASVLKSTEACKIPYLICGDFNDTPNSYVYHVLSQGMTDTFSSNGRGLGSTFAGAIPFLKIDYTLASKAIEVYDSGVIRKTISDHYPVYAVIAL